ncbi:helix-turn-helix transcriptional regulator [Saccharothrix mutabilis subsp. mutabilis]|uniref:Helix-turn-helix transcriptional regulator n=1 Tax=Saccharothrix mutabilis subsp. mutabilis TaxID=66855 RepID=A0ABN0UH71_9PSEU
MADRSRADPTVRADFGATLRRRRKLAGLSQKDLAARLGYHHSVISRWESGHRRPDLDLVRRVDAVLAAGGELVEALAHTADPDTHAADLVGIGPHAPLPGGLAVSGDRQAAWVPIGWPARLPHFGMSCPLHGADGCHIPSSEDAAVLYEAFVADPGAHTDEDTVHVLTARLAVYTRITEEHGEVGVDTAVEHVLHLIASALTSHPGPNRRALLHLAATHAAFAGQLRTLRGRHGAAMALYGKGLHWAMLCGDIGLRAALMCDMSTLARLEHDATSAVTYAEALPAIAPDRTWTRALSHLYTARAHAISGDALSTTRDAAAARHHLDRLTEDDGHEASWLAGVHGHVLVESGLAAAFRDIAAATADHRLAHAATTATEHCLAHVPAQLRPATVLLTLRLADCYACAGQPEAATAIASPVLGEARAMPWATVAHELRGLRTRLAARWPNLPPVREMLDHHQGWQ